jgi:excisionase family DNA binding protein
MGSNDSQRLLTVKEAAAYLGESTFTVYRKISAGIYPAVRLSNSPTGPIRVPERDLERWIFDDEQET